MSSELAELTAAEKALAEVETPADAKDLYDKLEALSQYAQRYRLDHEQQQKIARVKLATARKGGGILAESGFTTRPVRQLPEGFTKAMSSRWQSLADIPKDEWGRFLAQHDELTLKAALRLAREFALRVEREQLEVQAKLEIGDNQPTLAVADVKTWDPGTVDAIITDPPYIGDSIPLYEALRDFALRTLRQGGALAVMTWQAILPDVLKALEHSELAYRWTICWHYEHSANTVDYKRRVFDRWKPVLVFHRGAMPADAPMIADWISSPAPAKDLHDWQQSLPGFEQLVRSLSTPGDLVCDPFLGGGTTALAALAHTRRFTGCDMDPTAIETTERRLTA